jgi:hypothetical protein
LDHKANVDIPGFANIGNFFIALDCANLKNDVLFLATGRNSVAEQIAVGA